MSNLRSILSLFRARSLRALSLLTALVLLAGCKFDGRMSTFDPKGPLAAEQLSLWYVTLWVSVFLFVTVGGAFAFACIKFREKPSDAGKPLPTQSHGNPVVELGLIAFSVVCLVIIAIPTLRGIWMMHDLEAGFKYASDEEVLEVNAVGYQWWWAFEYLEEGIVTGNELVMPKDRVVKVNLRADDVIHSFWLPKIAGKTDLIPGQANWMWLLTQETGHYYGQCTEYCGEAHAYMLFRADVLEQDDYDAWVERMQGGAKSPHGETWNDFYAVIDKNPLAFGPEGGNHDPVKNGARLFMQKGGCVQCHAIDGSVRAVGILGPNLTNMGSRKSVGAGLLDNRPLEHEYATSTATIDPELQFRNLKHWVQHSEQVKPGNLMYETIAEKELTDQEFADIARFLQALTVEMP